MARKNMLDVTKLDPKMVSLVKVLNSIKGVTTVSCYGDPPKPGEPRGFEWTVIFQVAPNHHGWRALEFLAWLVFEACLAGWSARLEVLSEPEDLNQPGKGLEFHLVGWRYLDPEEYARMLDEEKEEFYSPLRQGRPSGR